MLVTVAFQSFHCNYTLYKMDTSLRRTTDTFETVNGQLGSALCSEKYFTTEIPKCRCFTWDYIAKCLIFVVLFQFAECILLRHLDYEAVNVCF